MNPKFLWLTDALQILSVFLIGPMIGAVIAYKVWRGRPENLSQYWNPCLASGLTAILLLVFAKWLNADVRTLMYFLQVACFVLGGLLFGVCMGCGFSVLLRMWYWHKRTRLS